MAIGHVPSLWSSRGASGSDPARPPRLQMPRLWLDYCQFLMDQGRITHTRRTFDRALRALPITQHSRIWPLYLRFLRSHPLPETAVRGYRRFLKVRLWGWRDRAAASRGSQRRLTGTLAPRGVSPDRREAGKGSRWRFVFPPNNLPAPAACLVLRQVPGQRVTKTAPACTELLI